MNAIASRGYSPLGLVLMVLAVQLVIALVSWNVGRAGAQGQALQEQRYASYDVGRAGKPVPTGKMKEFNLVAKEAEWEIAPGVKVPAITYNGQVPGPLLRITEGDTLKVTLKNELDEATSIHWHGLHVPNNMDGVPPFTQAPIEPGQSFTYEFPASHAGTFMYHSHLNSVEQIDRGLYGPLIVAPATQPPATFDKEFTMLLSAWDTNGMPGSGQAAPGGSGGMGGMAMNYNYFTINGKAFPDAPEWVVKEGDLVRVRLINISNLAHPMHLHGHDFTVVAKDGEPIRPEIQQAVNTLSVDAGETFDVVFRADNPGVWVFHCHELHHTENDGVEPGGLMQMIRYEGVPAQRPAADTASTPTPMPANMPRPPKPPIIPPKPPAGPP